MNKLNEALSHNSDLIIAAGVFDVILVILMEMPSKVMGGWETIIGANNFKGSAGIFLALIVLGAIVVHGFLFLRVYQSYKQSYKQSYNNEA
ncbi:MAG: hypothetical protein AB8B86_18125 [Pseudomonadales bacterium]